MSKSMIALCSPQDLDQLYEIINDAAEAYRGIIPADRWHEPYMTRDALANEIAHGVVFSGFYDGPTLAGVMGIQLVDDVALIRHAYTRTTQQRRGVGAALLSHLRHHADRPILIGTWKSATWAIKFYESHGFSLVPTSETAGLLRRYWTIPDRQIEESVVLADQSWFARTGTGQRR